MSAPDEDAFQRALLEALEAAADGRAPEEVRARLRADPRASGFEDYVDAMEPRMIAVAVALMARWSVREG